MNITLNGQNELIDRRAIVFTGDPKKKKPAETKASGDSETAEDKADKSSGAEESEDTVPEYVEDEDESDKPAGPPPVDKGAKSGCGCRAAGLDVQSGTLPMVSLLLLGLVAWSRRRAHL
jgi:hypothetical protein